MSELPTFSSITAVTEALEAVAAGVIREYAPIVDGDARFPQESIDALAAAGFFGVSSATDIGGSGLGLRGAFTVIERIAQECASTAMIMCMHYCGTAVIEAHGDESTRRDIAAGKHLSTLAFSERGSRSHFWAPLSTATPDGDHVVLNAHKSWVTSAGQATAYVWSATASGAEGSTLWLVPKDANGVEAAGGFDGLGLRGNDSRPITAKDARIPASLRLGGEGEGFHLMMGVVLPTFSLLNSACSLGLMTAATARTALHASGARYQHIDTALADLPTIRAYVARMQVKSDMVRGLLLDALTALETGREDAQLRVLEAKCAAGETATEVLDIAMRVCGGQAFRRDVGVERYFRDARAGTVMAPTTDVLYDFIGKAICGLPLF